MVKIKKSLAEHNPELSKSWHPNKNNGLSPSDVSPKSNKRVWWKCSKGHEWEAVIASRSAGRGCPYCSGSRATSGNNLAVLFPNLLKEWHYNKNNPLKPNELLPFSNKKVWWKCVKGHDWQTALYSRTGKNKTGCPYCSGKRATSDNNLAILFPSLLKEWHYKKNNPLEPNEIVPFSSKKVWWQCSKGHEWKTAIEYRTRSNTGCPYCSGRLASIDNCLQTRFPELTKEWHPLKNGKLSPKDVTPGSAKRVWWICSKGHEWKIDIYQRTGKKPTGCPYCSGKKVSPDNNLLALFPKITKEWHPDKNEPLQPDMLTPGSNKKVWWRCSKGHEWRTPPSHRTGKKPTGCPYCAGTIKRKIEDFRKLVEERGGSLIENENKGAHVPLKIKCKNDHIFKISFPNARAGKWCPYCSESIGEKLCRHALETIFKKKFPISNPKWLINPQTGGHLQLDGYCKSLKIAFEHQGIQHYEPIEMFGGMKLHIELKKRDRLKYQICKERGVKIIYLREVLGRTPLNKIKHTIEIQCKQKHIPLPKDFHEIQINYNIAYLGDYSEIHKKQIVDVLKSKKGAYLISENVLKSRSTIEIYCGNGHIFESNKYHLQRGDWCPYCSGRKVCDDNNLLVLFPEIAKEWHPDKNEPLKPHQVYARTGKKAWWQCSKGHEWRTAITYRTTQNTGCPYCSGKAVCADNNLLTLFPDIAKEWHPTKNGPLKPDMLVPGSNKAVWWSCSKGHEWKTSVNNRTGKKPTGCPYCSGNKASPDNNLLVLFPKITKEWHPDKNQPLQPDMLTPGSNKKVWWRCSKGHEWRTPPSHRTGKLTTGCPYCAGQKVSADNNLYAVYPEISKEWNYKKNKELSPKDVTSGSGKKVWWKCSKGHEWQAVIANRTSKNKTGCPYCYEKKSPDSYLQSMNPKPY